MSRNAMPRHHGKVTASLPFESSALIAPLASCAAEHYHTRNCEDLGGPISLNAVTSTFYKSFPAAGVSLPNRENTRTTHKGKDQLVRQHGQSSPCGCASLATPSAENIAVSFANGRIVTAKQD